MTKSRDVEADRVEENVELSGGKRVYDTLWLLAHRVVELERGHLSSGAARADANRKKVLVDVALAALTAAATFGIGMILGHRH